MLRSFLSDIYFLVSSKVEFLLHKNLWILFYFDHTGYTNADRRLMSARGQNRANPVFWVLSGHLARLGFSVLVPQEKVIFSPYNQSFIDRACLVKIAKYWPLFFLRFYCARVLLGSLKKYTHTSTQKHKKERGQYPDILTSRLVKNAYSIC